MFKKDIDKLTIKNKGVEVVLLIFIIFVISYLILSSIESISLNKNKAVKEEQDITIATTPTPTINRPTNTLDSVTVNNVNRFITKDSAGCIEILKHETKTNNNVQEFHSCDINEMSITDDYFYFYEENANKYK